MREISKRISLGEETRLLEISEIRKCALARNNQSETLHNVEIFRNSVFMCEELIELALKEFNEMFTVVRFL